MFEARLMSATTLKNILDAIKDLLHEGTFDCSDTGIQLQAKDNSHVPLVSLILRSDGFDKFRCDRNISMGINLDTMSKILQCANNGDAVTVKVQDNADTVTFMFGSANHEKVSIYEMKLINLEQKHVGIPENDYSCNVRMPSVEFARICRDLAQFSESMVICCTKEGVKFSAAGDVGSANVKLAQTVSVYKEEEAVVIEVQEPVMLTFSCKYLNAFTNASLLSAQVQLSMSPDVPLVVEYRIPDLGHIRYYLAITTTPNQVFMQQHTANKSRGKPRKKLSEILLNKKLIALRMAKKRLKKLQALEINKILRSIKQEPNKDTGLNSITFNEHISHNGLRSSQEILNNNFQLPHSCQKEESTYEYTLSKNQEINNIGIKSEITSQVSKQVPSEFQALPKVIKNETQKDLNFHIIDSNSLAATSKDTSSFYDKQDESYIITELPATSESFDEPCASGEIISNTENISLANINIKKEQLLEDISGENDIHNNDFYFDDETSQSRSTTFDKRPNSAQRQAHRTKCAVSHCQNHFSNKKITFYKLPNQLKLRSIWFNNYKEAAAETSEIILSEMRKFKLCKEHFEDICFIGDRMLFGSTPTVNLGPNNVKNLQDCKEILASFRKYRCRINDCQRSVGLDQITKFPFPPSSDVELHSKWLFNLGLQESDSSESNWICQIHFERRVKARNRLKPDAVPTLLLGTQAPTVNDLHKNPAYITRNQQYMQYRQVCCVPSCSNTKKSVGRTVKFADFPRQKEIFQKWLHNLELENCAAVRKSYQICWDHFETVCHTPTDLKRGSIPTLKLNKTSDLYTLDESEVHEPKCYGFSEKYDKNEWAYIKAKCSHPLCKDEMLNIYPGPKIPQLQEIWYKSFNQKEELQDETSGDMKLCDEHFYSLYKQFEKDLHKIEAEGDFKDEIELLKNTFNKLAVKTKFFGRHCLVDGCETDFALPEHQTDRQLFSFPNNPEVSKKWCHNCNVDYEIVENSVRNYYKICDRHFETICFATRSLFCWAVPTLNLPHNRPAEIYELDPDCKVGYIGNCCITSCVNNEGLKLKTHSRLYKFPENPVQRSKWLHNVNCENFQEEKTKICGLHFRATHFNRRKALNALAIPVLKLYPHRELSEPIYMDIRDLGPRYPTEKKKKTKKGQSGENQNGDRDTQFFDILPFKQEIIEDQYGLEAEQQQQIKYDHLPLKEECNANTTSWHIYDYSQGKLQYDMPPLIKEEIMEIDESQQQKQNDVSVVVKEEINEANNYDITDINCVPENATNNSITSTITFPRQIMSVVKSQIFVCCVERCCSNSETLGVRLYTEFPNASEIFIKWCFNLKIDPRHYQENQYAICSQHFEAPCFKDGNLTLHNWAVPTLNLNLPENSFIHQNAMPNEQCIVHGCIQPLYPFYNFPIEMTLCQKWYANLKLDLNVHRSRNIKICRRHFATECFGMNLKLKSDAIPSLYLGHSDRILYLNRFETRVQDVMNYDRNNAVGGGIEASLEAVPAGGVFLVNSCSNNQGSAVLAAAGHLISPNDLEDHNREDL